MKKLQKTLLGLGLAAGCVAAIAGSAVAYYGGGQVNGQYRGALPSDWFEGEACMPTLQNPINFVVNGIYQEYTINVDGVANDGNPNTYLRCQQQGQLQTQLCNLGLADGTVVGCEQDNATHALADSGDIVYLTLLVGSNGIPVDCGIVVETSFGEANPACRTGSNGNNTGNFPCDATNSQAVNKGGTIDMSVGECFYYNKTFGQMQFATWSGGSFTVQAYDQSGDTFSQSYSSNGYAPLTGVDNGTVYFYLSANGGVPSIPVQVDDFN